jgi:hypothetical protein
VYRHGEVSGQCVDDESDEAEAGRDGIVIGTRGVKGRVGERDPDDGEEQVGGVDGFDGEYVGEVRHEPRPSLCKGASHGGERMPGCSQGRSSAGARLGRNTKRTKRRRTCWSRSSSASRCFSASHCANCGCRAACSLERRESSSSRRRAKVCLAGRSHYRVRLSDPTRDGRGSNPGYKKRTVLHLVSELLTVCLHHLDAMSALASSPSLMRTATSASAIREGQTAWCACLREPRGCPRLSTLSPTSPSPER